MTLAIFLKSGPPDLQAAVEKFREVALFDGIPNRAAAGEIAAALLLLADGPETIKRLERSSTFIV